MHALPLPPNDDGSSSVKQVCLYTATVRHRLLTFCCRFFLKKARKCPFWFGGKTSPFFKTKSCGRGMRTSSRLHKNFMASLSFFSSLNVISFLFFNIYFLLFRVAPSRIRRQQSDNCRECHESERNRPPTVRSALNRRNDLVEWRTRH